MPHSNRVLMATAIAVVVSSSMSAQSRPATPHQLDSIAGADVRANRSVGVVAAANNGKDKLLLEAYGKADVEANAPLTLGTLMPIGSVTKQFTAVAILQLRDQGKLGLDDDITKWLPELNTGGNRVTPRHLLSHTAGVIDLVEMRELREAQLMRNASLTRDSVYKVISRYQPAFAAGSMQMYSNTGYWLLGRIIEKVSGVKYEEYVEKRILTPVGMTHSMHCERAKQTPNRANGYFIRNGAPVREPDVVHTGTYAAGAICSTAGDMITWLQALHGGKVLSPKSYAELIAPAKLSDGTPTRYGMGTTVAEDSRGMRYVGHSGGGFGFSSETRWYPDAQLAVVVLTNSEPDAVTKSADDIAASVLPAPRVVGQFSGDVASLAGKYKGPAHGSDMIVVVTPGQQGIQFAIQGQPAETLPWVEGSTFRKGGTLLSFRSGTLRFDTGGDHFILKQVPAGAATLSAPLTAFEGTYEGQQPGATVRIAIESDTLRVLPSGGGRGNLIPESGTTFFNGREGSPRTVTFNLGPDGKVVSMTLKAPGSERTLKKLP